MKKLLVTVVGATAAIGAFAYTNTVRFVTDAASPDAAALNTAAQTWNSAATGTYVSEYNDATKTNEYAVTDITASGTLPAAEASPLGSTPSKELSVKTRFGKPLEFHVNPTAAQSIGTGIYFDSLVKFTVCDSFEDQAAYDDAKIIMWLQETDTQPAETNLYVKAGYMWNNNGVVDVSNVVYKCDNEILGDFADKWHRVTIKAMSDITADDDGLTVPGFAIFIDGGNSEIRKRVATTDAKWDDGLFELSDAADKLNEYGQVFPSMNQDVETGTKLTLDKVGFDGTGSVNDIAFTDVAPFAEAQDYVAPKATVNGTEYPTLEAAVAAVNAISSGDVTFALMKDMTLSGTLAFASSANVVFDFAGFVLTNNGTTPAISNNGYLVITNSTGNGGVVCTSTGAAVVSGDEAGRTDIMAGFFDGSIVEDGLDILLVYGGSFKDKTAALAPGKVYTSDADPTTGLYDVDDYVAPTYTVTFISGEGSTTNEYTEIVEGAEQAVPTPAAVEGKSFSAWDPAIAGATVTVVADATYTAQYTNNIYTITFVIGESSSSVQKEYGSAITSVPQIPVRAGYTGAWDDDPEGDTVTGDKTYTYTYSAETYTITYKTAEGEAFTAWADQYVAPTSFTVVASATLPAAANVALALGVTFNGWTNDVGAAVTTTEGLTADLVVFANVTVPGPSEPTIDPASSTTVEVTASTKQDAIDAVAVAAPAAAGIETAEEKAAYKALFDIDATNTSGDTWEVEIVDIKEEVKEAVATRAEAIVSGTAETGTVTVPKGLYYKVTTYETLGGTPTVAIETVISTGTASSAITKPGTTQGFIKVEMATTAAELAD